MHGSWNRALRTGYKVVRVLVLCVVACIFQPKTPLPSLTETYIAFTNKNGFEEVLVEGRQYVSAL